MSINMEFRNVVFNAARDGKLRRLKVRLKLHFECNFDQNNTFFSFIKQSENRPLLDFLDKN